MGKLFLLFTLLPFAEIYLLIGVTRFLGLPATLALIIATGILGASLTRAEGLRLLQKWQSEVAAGRLPQSSLPDGILLLIGGIFLITPGILTDLTGLFLLTPGGRNWIRKKIQAWFEKLVQEGKIQVLSPQDFSTYGAEPSSRTKTVEGEVLESRPLETDDQDRA